MQKPFFSVVIPALDEEKYLPELLSDLHKQSYAAFEIIVVDGGSKDATQIIAQKAVKKDPRVKLVISAKQNVGHQRNLGAKKAKGAYLLFLDADNRIPIYFLEGIHYQLMKKSSDAFTCWAKADTKNANDKLLITLINIIFETTKKIERPCISGACIGCKKKIFHRVNGFQENIRFMEDSEFIRKVVDKNFTYSIFREPLFTWSLRRFRKEGTLKIIREIIPIWITFVKNSTITDTDVMYPMIGGSYFSQIDSKKSRNKKPKTVLFIRNLEHSLRHILSSKQKNLQKKFLKYIDELL